MRRILLAAAILAVSIGGAAAAPKTLVISIQADPTGFDPEAVLNNTSGFVMSTVFDSLVQYEPGGVTVEPGLAKSWDISDDGKTYTFHLREDVKFQDGTAFDAEAYVDGLDRLLDESDPDYIYNTGPVEGYIDFTYDPVASYEATDDSTVVFKLKKPFAPFLSSLAMVWNGVVSPEAVHKYGKDFRNNPVGTGPFVFKEWQHGDHITLDANPDYWDGKPKVDRIIFKVIPEPQTALLSLKDGAVDIMGDVVTQVIPAIKSDSNLELLTQPGLTINGIGLPTDTKPFDDPKVRQALNYAVDKEAINKGLYKDLAVTMTSPLPPAEWSFDESLDGYPYDPEKAGQLLAEAGYPDGFKAELLAYNSARGYNPAGGQLAVAVQGYLQKVGIDVNIQQMEFGAFLAKTRSGNYHGMFMTGWSGDNGDPDNFLYELLGSANIPVGNSTHYHNPELDKVLVEARHETDHARRVKLYKKAQNMIVEGAPWIFGNSTLQVRAIRKEVKGFRLNPMQMFFDMQNVSLEE